MSTYQANRVSTVLLGFGLTLLFIGCGKIGAVRDDIVRVPAAKVEYDVPGDWDVSGKKPMDAERVCYPQLRRHNQDEIINVVTPPMLGKQTLEDVAHRYAAVIEKVLPVGKCEISSFTSEHKVGGFNIRYKGSDPQTSDPTIIVNSVFIIINHSGDAVFVQYIAAEPLFRSEVDEAIKKSLNYMADGKM